MLSGLALNRTQYLHDLRPGRVLLPTNSLKDPCFTSTFSRYPFSWTTFIAAACQSYFCISPHFSSPTSQWCTSQCSTCSRSLCGYWVWTGFWHVDDPLIMCKVMSLVLSVVERVKYAMRLMGEVGNNFLPATCSTLCHNFASTWKGSLAALLSWCWAMFDPIIWHCHMA